MRRGQMGLVVAVSYLTPLLATLVTCYYLAVPLGPGLLAACGLVVAGAVLSSWAVSEISAHGSPPRRDRRPQPLTGPFRAGASPAPLLLLLATGSWLPTTAVSVIPNPLRKLARKPRATGGEESCR